MTTDVLWGGWVGFGPMPRKLRLEYAGAIYHVMNRGDRRESIFLGEEDRQLFVETLGEACQKTGWQVHAYCLMGNHFHQQEAERLVGEMLRQAGWTEGELANRRKGEARKARMAARLRSETVMTWGWIAGRLKMGHWRTAANAVQRFGRE